MNCHDAEPLLLAESDGVLTSAQHAALSAHLGSCPACQQLRANVAEALSTLKSEAANVSVPDAGGEWRTIRAQLQSAFREPEKRRPSAPILWLAVPLAAALVLAFFIGLPTPGSPDFVVQVAEGARADFVEVDDANVSTMVYVDKDSGWLVVWAVDESSATSG